MAKLFLMEYKLLNMIKDKELWIKNLKIIDYGINV